MRHFIHLAYNGTAYCGWQSQPDAPSVQQTLEKALSVLLRQPIAVTGAGRTDTGVHALEMFAHFNTESLIDGARLSQRLNAFLPRDIAVYDIFEVPDNAHARFDATARTYHYKIHQRKTPFLQDQSYYFQRALDFEAMNDAAAELLLHNDFKCFSKIHTDVSTFRCDITEAKWTSTPQGWVFTITADRFLRNMVRAIVGTLLNVGQGKLTRADVAKIIESRDRSNAGFSVPACGLYLARVQYNNVPPLNATLSHESQSL